MVHVLPAMLALAVALGAIDAEKCDETTVETSGVVTDAARDDTDPRFDVIVLRDGDAVLPAFLNHAASEHAELIDARVSVRGTMNRILDGKRSTFGPYLGIVAEQDVRILTPAPDPFAAPTLERVHHISPREVSRLGRRRVSGTVVAAWRGNRILLETNLKVDFPIRADLANADELPPCGATVTVSGYPETDSYRVNLGRARCRIDAPPKPGARDEAHVPAERLTFRVAGFLDADFYGRLVRATGIVRTLSTDAGERKAVLESHGTLVTVDASACPDVLDGSVPGCRVEATGIAYVDTPRWTPGQTLQHARGYELILRRAEDLRILERPPWWTPARLWSVVAILVCAVLGVLVWNAALRALVERRSRALYRERLEGEKARLKTEERTRLAVELHDALSQSLTGVAMEISAAARARTSGDQHLPRAERALKNCRDELRNCLWDLRSQALEEPDLTRAIASTLAPCVSDRTRVDIRFNVPRARLTDNQTHAVLRSVRELAVNAISHGGATCVKVAGTLDGECLRFAVRDNGSGFDPATAPSVREGHFGLQGLRERIRAAGGTIILDAAPGRGTSVLITLPLAK